MCAIMSFIELKIEAFAGNQEPANPESEFPNIHHEVQCEFVAMSQIVSGLQIPHANLACISEPRSLLTK
jgi:hypothetical protein